MLMLLADLTPWTWVGLAGWLLGGLFFIGYEALGLRRSDDQWPTLTNVVKRYVPKWLMAMLLGWLAFHFLSGERTNR